VALRYIAGSVKSKQGTAILDALELLDSDVLKPLHSRYAKQILDQLAQKGKGQVLNRSEIVKEESGVDYWERCRRPSKTSGTTRHSQRKAGDGNQDDQSRERSGLGRINPGPRRRNELAGLKTA